MDSYYSTSDTRPYCKLFSILLNSQLNTWRCLKMSTIPRLVFLKEFSEANHWPECFCPQGFHNTTFCWISVFVLPHKIQSNFFLHIYDPGCFFPLIILLHLNCQLYVAVSCFPHHYCTTCKSEMWDDVERILKNNFMYISNSFFPSQWRLQGKLPASDK